jgi:hypothetical protein
MSDHGKSVVNSKDMDMELIYAALIAYSEDDEAIEFMAEHDYEVSRAKMAVFRRGCTELVTSPYFQPYQERKEELAPILQKQLENDLLGVASTATTAVQFAVDQATDRLEKGECNDPARTARDLMQVATQSVDKRQLLKGEPTAIVGKLDTDEILRSLEGLGVVKRVEAIEATAEES